MNVVLGNVGAAGMQVYGQVDRQMLHKKLQQYVEDSGLVRSPQGLERIHGLWDELADFGAYETDAALTHALRTTSALISAQQAFWMGTVRLLSDNDPLCGWRIRTLKRLHESDEDRRVLKQAQQYHDSGIFDPVTVAQARLAGRWRAHLLRELAPPDFETTHAYDVLYRSRGIRDALFAGFPVNNDAESIFGWYRVGEDPKPFAPEDRDVVTAVFRPLKWFHRRIMLARGLVVAEAPLTAVERRLARPADGALRERDRE